MALTKSEEIVVTEIVSPFKHIQTKTATIVKEDGVEISRSNLREAYTCNQTISSDWPQEVQDLANLLWTDSVKTAYATHLANSLPS